jgi:hypothetical protein
MDNPKQQDYVLDEPIGKEKPFKMGIILFFATLLAVMAAYWGLLEPMKLSEKIFIQGTYWPWVYFFGVSILISALVVMSRLAQYYRFLYRMYRERSWIDNIYLTRADLQGKYRSLIENAKKTIDVFGMSLHTLIQNPEIRNAIVSSSIGKNRVKYRFLLHHPECLFLRERSTEEGKKEERISDDSRAHLKDLIGMRESAKVSNGTIEIGTLKDKMPDCFYFKQDDMLFVEPYLMGYTGRDCPVFCIKKNAVNAPVFDAFVNAMELKWNAANK